VPLPPAPTRSFASDNFAGAHPAVVDAIARANVGHAMAYGGDPWTARCRDHFHDLFGAHAESFLVWNGTGANVLALATMVQPAQAVVCTSWSHIAVDETGAPERIVGSKLIDVPTPDAKLRPEHLDDLAHLLGSPHHAQPGVVSLTQCTELGTLYTPDEIAAVCDRARHYGMTVHLDGARIANATAALGGTVDALRSFTVDTGIDVVSFGGTKNGLLGGEAVVYLSPELARRAEYVRKQVTQLPSKMRFLAAQFDAILTDGLWIELAAHANAMATDLHARTTGISGVTHTMAPQVNSVFPTLPPALIGALRDWCFFWDWDVSRNQVRWMTSWDTTPADVAAFAEGVRILAGGEAPDGN
jgi:threonine aldolase